MIMQRRTFSKLIVTAAIALCSLSTFAAPIKVACIGDSITAGVGAKNRQTQAYPAQLQTQLGAGYEVKNCGTSGIQMQNYLAAKGLKWGDQITAFQPDIVTIKLGTNDTKGRKADEPENKAKFDDAFRAASLGLIEFLQGLESKPTIYLCYPVPVFVDKWGINEKGVVEDVIPALKKIAAEKSLPLIDLYRVMEGKGALVPDGIHPNEVAYKMLAETIAAEIASDPAVEDEAKTPAKKE
jgi:acyl-CoA thioesterase-1